GAGLRRVLHLGDRGLAAQGHKAVVAADRHEGEAHLDRLFCVRRCAAMQPGLHLVPLAGVDDLFQRDHHPFVGLVAARRIAMRNRQVAGTDIDRVEALDRQNVVQVLHRLDGLDHAERDDDVVGLGVVIGAAVDRGADRSRAAATDRGITHRADEFLGLGAVVDHRTDDAVGAGVERIPPASGPEVKRSGAWALRYRPAIVAPLTSRWGNPMPSRRWYFAALLLALVGAGGAGIFLWARLPSLDADMVRMVAPGEMAMDLQPGSYTIFHEYRSVVKGQFYESNDVSGLRVGISAAAGEAVTLTGATD